MLDFNHFNIYDNNLNTLLLNAESRRETTVFILYVVLINTRYCRFVTAYLMILQRVELRRADDSDISNRQRQPEGA